MPRREISLSRAVAPIYGAPHRIRTFHADCQSRRPGVESGQFTLDKVVTVTLPLIRTGAGLNKPYEGDDAVDEDDDGMLL